MFIEIAEVVDGKLRVYTTTKEMFHCERIARQHGFSLNDFRVPTTKTEIEGGYIMVFTKPETIGTVFRHPISMNLHNYIKIDGIDKLRELKELLNDDDRYIELDDFRARHNELIDDVSNTFDVLISLLPEYAEGAADEKQNL